MKGYIMTFYVEFDMEVSFDFSVQSLSEKIVQAVLEQEACPYEIECNLLITDKEGIREYNKEYREVDSFTDVLSFPNLDFEEPSNFSIVEQESMQGTYFNLDSGELVLGDVIICTDIMIEHAREYGHSVLREFSFLMVHSLLHLLGYDHMEEAEREVMESRQKKVLETLGIARDS